MDLTIGQISTFLAFLVGFISSVVYLSKIIQKIVKKTLEPINKSINNLDVSQCKNFLVRFLADIEQGNEIDEVEREREVLKEQAMNEGKPADIAEKMVEGRINKFYKEICLSLQAFIKDGDIDVTKYVTNNGGELIGKTGTAQKVENGRYLVGPFAIDYYTQAFSAEDVEE